MAPFFECHGCKELHLIDGGSNTPRAHHCQRTPLLVILSSKP